MTEKKATDLLLEIIATQTEIIGFVRNIDFTNKLILSKLQSPALNTVVAAPVQNLIVNPVDKIDFPQVATPQPKSKLQIALEQEEQEQMENDLLTEESNLEGRRRTQRYVSPSIKKIPVQQRITYQDGKSVFMANVEIFDSNATIVKKTRTNQIGNWLAALPVGDYTVKIEKAATSLKPKVELAYTVSVPSTDQNQIEFETKKV